MKARAYKGRLIIEEATDLPDGTELELEIVGSSDMDPAELAELRKVLAESEAEEQAGHAIDADEVLAELDEMALSRAPR